MKKILFTIVLIFNFFAIFGLAMACACSRISPDILGIAGLFGLAYNYFFMANVVCFVFWLFTRYRRRCLLSLAFLTLTWGFTLHIFRFSGNTMPENLKNRSFKVLTYNVHSLQPIDNQSHSKFLPALQKFICEQNADIVCLQEFPNETDNAIADNAKKIGLPYYFVHPKVHKTGVVTFSRYPIVGSEIVYKENSTNACMYSDIVVRGDSLRVFNVHLKSTALGNERALLDNALRTDYSNDDMRMARGILRKLVVAARRRARQVAIVKPYIDASPYPTIICGDFNDPPFSYAYRQMRGNLNDAFMEAGSMMAPTYKIGRLSRQRIDYILCSPKIDAYNFDCPRFGLSDHRPVICEFVVKSAQP